MKNFKKWENLHECLQHLGILTLRLNIAQKCHFSCLNGVKVESQAKQNVINILLFARPLLALLKIPSQQKKHLLFIYVHCVGLASQRHTTVSVSQIKERTDKTKVSAQTFIKIQAIQHLISKLDSSTDKTNPWLDFTTFCFKASEIEHRWRNLEPLSKVFCLKFIHGWDDNYVFTKTKLLPRPICVRIEIHKILSFSMSHCGHFT